jgi:hypothetical protein
MSVEKSSRKTLSTKVTIIFSYLPLRVASTTRLLLRLLIVDYPCSMLYR